MFLKALFASSLLTLSLSGTNARTTRRATCPDGNHTATNTACCTWYSVLDDIQENLFDGTCGADSHETLRLAFHDAVGYSPTNGGGGADGSIITFADTELAYTANLGMEDAVDVLTPYVSKWNVTPGDMIYFAAAVGFTNCPGAPRMDFYSGRAAPTAASPDGTVSQATDTVDEILARFSELDFSSDEVVALLASHSTATAVTTDPTIPGTPLDSTSGIFDSQIYIETLLNGTLWPGTSDNAGEVESPLANELRLQSDYAIARDSRTACTWQGYIEDQDGMREAFAAAFVKMSLIQQSVDDLTDCSEVIPDVISNTAEPYYPGTLTITDVQQACTGTTFPSLVQSPSVTAAS